MHSTATLSLCVTSPRVRCCAAHQHAVPHVTPTEGRYWTLTDEKAGLLSHVASRVGNWFQSMAVCHHSKGSKPSLIRTSRNFILRAPVFPEPLKKSPPPYSSPHKGNLCTPIGTTIVLFSGAVPGC